MFEVIVRQSFSSAHALRDYHGSTEPLHGHNFEVEVILRGKALQKKVKYLVDFIEVQQALQAVVKSLDHVNLNETPPFDRENPSAENIALYIRGEFEKKWRALPSGRQAPGVRIASVTVWETPHMAARVVS
jgi:6-pyruvoyltetrahydropterin/6-carboxytetrahydropterin synthase